MSMSMGGRVRVSGDTPPTGCISGTVTKVVTGEPLAGKKVKLKVSRKRPRVNGSVLTDEEGCYHFTDLDEVYIDMGEKM